MADSLLPCAVVGGGIGGLVLALALQQRGIQASVYERAPELREIGAGLLISPNAVSILEALGLKDALRQSGLATPEWRVLDYRGRTLSRVRPGMHGFSGISLRRADLQTILVDHLAPGSLRLGHEAMAFRPGAAGDSAVVTFRDRGEIEAEVVVAADGIHSLARAQVLEDTRLRPSHYVGWRAIVETVPRGWEHGLVTESWGVGQRFGIAATGQGRCYWYATANKSRAAIPAGQNRRDLLLALFRDWHEPVAALIAAAPVEAILESEIAERPLPRHWSRGRITLLGDSLHAMTPNLGQGAAMAIEDAWELTSCLTASAGSVDDRLTAYAQRRRRRVQAVQWASRFVGLAIQWENPALVGLRDLSLRLTPAWMAERSLRWLFHPRTG